MSAESGIATFRDALTGHWARFDPMELASEAGFRANPQRVWGWYAERSAGVQQAQPNAGHQALASFAQRHPGVLTLVTQNVDDLPLRAINAAEAAATQCALMLVGGTSGAVWPAAGLAGRARRSGAQMIIVNPQASEIDEEAHRCLAGTAAEVLPLLLA